MNPELLALAKALQPFVAAAANPKFKHNTPTGTPSTPYYTGPGGLFGVLGLERDLISSRIQPLGIASSLPALGTNVMNPLYAYITGFKDGNGDEPSTVCDDAPTAGAGKGCLQTAVFGRYTRMTRELEVNRLGQKINNGEADLVIMNDPLAKEIGGIFAQRFALGRQYAGMLGNEMLMRFMEIGVAFQNLLCPQVYTGNPDNNIGTGYAEFVGLDILISTGKRDALTGTACPSLDSDVKDFNYGKVDDVEHADIVNVMTYLMRYLKHNASRMSFGTVQWRIAMREDLFYEITAIWPCSYLTYRCKFRTDDGTVVENVSANDQIAMRDAMRNGNYLLIDGVQYAVEFDDAIAEETATTTSNVTSGCFASNIYVIPYTVMGGRPVTFWQYFDYSANVMPQISQGNYQDDFWTDGGRFLWHKKPPLNWCVQHIAKTEPRLIMLTPQLAGKITHVQYCPLQHTRDAFPTDPYWVDGGVTDGRDAPSWYVKPA